MADNPCDIEISPGYISDSVREGVGTFILSTGKVASILVFSMAAITIDHGTVTDAILSDGAGPITIDHGTITDSVSDGRLTSSVIIEKMRVRDFVVSVAGNTAIDHGTVSDLLVDKQTQVVIDRGRVADLVVHSAKGGRVSIDKGRVRDFFLNRSVEASIVDHGTLADFTAQSLRVAAQVIIDHGTVDSFLQDVNATTDTVRDGGHVADFVTSSVETMQVVIDAAFAEDFVTDDFGSFLWSAEAETFGMSRISAGGLSSLALVNGALAACSDDGLCSFAGPSSPYIRTGRTDFGSGYEKRAGYVYVGYNGQPVTLTVTAAPEGTEVSYNYPLPPRTAAFDSPGKEKLGRGMRSRYWQFALSGTVFALNDVELIMDTTSRKI